MKEIPRKVYQRKKALMSRPGMVLKRLRWFVVAAVVFMRGLGGAGRNGEVERPGSPMGSMGGATCRFNCIVWLPARAGGV